MSLCFVDSVCPACMGKGWTCTGITGRRCICEECEGVGSVGSVVDTAHAKSKPTPFGLRLRKWRESAGITLHEIAKQTGLSPRKISDIERGRAYAAPSYKKRLRKLMSVQQNESPQTR